MIRPSDDPGSLSVAMKLNASISRLTGARNNVQNGTSFLEVQDGILDGVGKIVTRMSELKGLGSQDPMKSDQDIESYNLEFRDLQRQLYDMSQMTFNGVSLFANFSSPQTGVPTESIFRDTADATNHTVSIHTSTQGSAGSKISLHKSKLLAALTMEIGDLDRANNAGANSTFNGKNNAAIKAAGTAATTATPGKTASGSWASQNRLTGTFRYT